MARCTSINFVISGTAAYKNGSNGIYHAQAEWIDGIKDLTWTIDADETVQAWNTSLPSQRSGKTELYTMTYTLDNGQTYIISASSSGRKENWGSDTSDESGDPVFHAFDPIPDMDNITDFYHVWDAVFSTLNTGHE